MKRKVFWCPYCQNGVFVLWDGKAVCTVCEGEYPLGNIHFNDTEDCAQESFKVDD